MVGQARQFLGRLAHGDRAVREPHLQRLPADPPGVRWQSAVHLRTGRRLRAVRRGQVGLRPRRIRLAAAGIEPAGKRTSVSRRGRLQTTVRASDCARVRGAASGESRSHASRHHAESIRQRTPDRGSHDGEVRSDARRGRGIPGRQREVGGTRAPQRPVRPGEHQAGAIGGNSRQYPHLLYPARRRHHRARRACRPARKAVVGSGAAGSIAAAHRRDRAAAAWKRTLVHVRLRDRRVFPEARERGAGLRRSASAGRIERETPGSRHRGQQHADLLRHRSAQRSPGTDARAA